MRSPEPTGRDYCDRQVSTQAAGTPEEQLREAGHAARTMPLGDPDDWIRIAARAGATPEEIAEAGRVPVGHVRSVLDAKAWRQPRMDQPQDLIGAPFDPSTEQVQPRKESRPVLLVSFNTLISPTLPSP